MIKIEAIAIEMDLERSGKCDVIIDAEGINIYKELEQDVLIMKTSWKNIDDRFYKHLKQQTK
jgi:hypothetical protein